MASLVAGNWEQMDGHDDNFELSPRNHNLLMSLLDETQVDECDDERLKHVIRSLEAEIDSTSHFDHDGAWESDLVDCESSIDESNGLDSSTTSDDLDHLHWMDMEIVPCSPSGEMGSEYGWVKNFSCVEADQDYGSLWHETNAINYDY